MEKTQKNFLTFGDRSIVEMFEKLGGDISKLTLSTATRKNDAGETVEVTFSDNDYNRKQGRVDKKVLDLDNKSQIHQQNLAKAEVFFRVFDLQMKR